MTVARTTPCVLYAAKSTEDRHGSIPTQLEDDRRMAEREGWEIIDGFQDEGFSAYHGNRGPGLEQARELAEKTARERGVPCMLVAQHSDRFARGAGDAPEAADHFVEVVLWANRHNVVIRTVQDDYFADPQRNVSEAANSGQRNTEDSRRKSEAVKSAKDRQMAAGTKLGGPPPEGLLLVVERDDQDRVTARRYERDPERAPIIERIFELSEEGHGDAAIARTLNADGLRSKAGKAWTRRSVQDKLLNQHYAGRAVRKGRGSKQEYRLLENPEVVQATNIEPLIDPDRYDRITAMREGRDRVKARGKDGLRRGDRGQKTAERYALSKLAVCDRCGERMYAATSPYKRKTKGGTKARRYVCAHVRNATGECDQPPLDAEKIDAAVVEYLDALFIDFDAWLTEIKQTLGSKRSALETELARVEKELNGAHHATERIQRRYIEREAEAEGSGRGIEGALDAAQTKQDELEKRVRFLRGEVARADESVNADALLDTYNDIAEAVRGHEDKLNERLRAKFAAFHINQTDDGWIGILPVLHPQTFNPVELWEAWEEAGEPDPTAAEIAHDRVISDGIWVGSPPVRPLAVLSGRGTDSQE
jgi:DNA invertase Pin-like site-specific DNA recombinase